MKSNLLNSKRMMHYAASAAAFLTLNNANGAVVYTDLDPDLAIGGEGGEISVDINSDGDDDFTFFLYSVSGVGTYYGINFTYDVKIAGAAALNGNEFVGSIVTNSGYSGVYSPILPSGEGINIDDAFAEGSASLAVNLAVSVSGFPYYGYQGGNWSDANMAFMGFRLNIDKDHYYGWMRISVSVDATVITIHDYAYEDVANQSIFTGQTATAIADNSLIDSKIYSNEGTIFVNLPSTASNSATASIIDLSGKLVKTETLQNSTNALDCSDLPSGNYVVKVTDGDMSVKKQINLIK